MPGTTSRSGKAGWIWAHAFKGLTKLWRARRGLEALGEVRLPEELTEEAGAYRVHPVLLDACQQAVLAALPETSEGLYLPMGLERLNLYGKPPRECLSHVVVRPEVGASGGEVVSADVRVLDESGQVVLEVLGLRSRKVERGALRRLTQASVGEWLYEVAWQSKPRGEVSGAAQGRWLILGDKGGVGARLAEKLKAKGASAQLLTADEALEKELRSGSGLKGVVHLWGLDAKGVKETTASSLREDQARGSGSLLRAVQVLVKEGGKELPSLYVVTRGAQAVGEAKEVSVAQAPEWGLGRVIRLEHPELGCRQVDLWGEGTTEEQAEALLEELLAKDGEEQVALRSKERFVARLVRAKRGGLRLPESEAFGLVTSKAGSSEHLEVRSVSRRPPGPGEVEIEVSMAGLNFRDVLTALGEYPGRPPKLGAECAGTVVRVGEGVDFKVGAAVLAIAPHCLGRYVIANAQWVAPKPRL